METMTKKNYIADRETYLTLKEVQKAIAIEIKSARAEYRKAVSAWAKEEPRSVWGIPKLHLSENAYNARELNIIYGMLRGKTYKQIEPKVKENNPPSRWALDQILAKYHLNPNDFSLDKETE